MKCAECISEGERSTVTPSGGTVTLMGWTPFYDEDGEYHSHDPNWHNNGFRCSRGHQWSTSSLASCPSCDYGKEQDG